MQTDNKRTISQVKKELTPLTDWWYLCQDKRVRALVEQIKAENAPKIETLRKELEQLQNNKPKPKPRWPETTPPDVIKECQEYWKGTEQYWTFRIHCWNDKAICTSWPSGGYTDNGGWHPSPATFYFLSRTEKKYDKAKHLAELEGRQSAKTLQQKLEEVTNENC
jgi:hypothetical protein